MLEKHRPRGPAPTTLEANILKLRAFETVLVLFYIEELKNFIIQSIEATDRFRPKKRLMGASGKSGKKLELARGVLVAEGIITEAESTELKNLIDYRNTIGHEIQKLTVAIGAYSHLADYDLATLESIDRYDNQAVEKAKFLRGKISKGMMSKFIMTLSSKSLQFESAETTYQREIKNLRIKVKKNIDQYNNHVAETNKLIRAIPQHIFTLAQPGHPEHQKENGNLTKQGQSCIFQLYDAKASPFAAAHLMRISLSTANRWFKRWRAVG